MILSASRKTDIPAFFSDWFINRIKEGFLCTRNPLYPEQVSRINLDPDTCDCIVFWTKNPAPMIPKLDTLADYNYYFQFTLTGYDKDIEINLPDKNKLIDTFKELSLKIGKERVIWRYDPILVNDKYTIDWHINTFSKMASELNGYTERCVISFLDFYPKIQDSVNTHNIRKISTEEMTIIASNIIKIATANNMTVGTCAESIDLDALGIEHNACIDGKIIEKICKRELKTSVKKDPSQRALCQCVTSRDIGSYGTCMHGCVYCYANPDARDIKKKLENYDPLSTMLCDSLRPGDIVSEPKIVSSFKKKKF